MRKLLLLSCLAYMLNGIAHVVVGSILEPMVHDYGLLYEDGGQLIMNQFLGFLAGVLAAPWLIGRIGRKATLLLALGALALAQFVYGMAPAWNWMLTAAPLAGLGFGMTEALVGAFVIIAATERTAVAMSRVEMFFGIGALLMPLLAAYLIKSGAWIASFWFVAGLSVVTLILWAVFWPEQLNESHHADRIDSTGSLGNAERSVHLPAWSAKSISVLILVALFFFFYVGLEMSFANYLPSILIENSALSESNATIQMGLFWGAIAVGRIFAGNIALRTGNAAFLIITCAASALVFILLAMVTDLYVTIALTLLNGLLMAGMFAMALVFINQVIPGRTERNTSLMVAFGGLGGALFPRLTGTMMDVFDASFTQWMLAVLAILLFLVIVAASIFSKEALRISTAADS